MDSFREIWFLDFEFCQWSGDVPRPLCYVARELKSNRLIRSWLEGERSLSQPPYLNKSNLVVAYYASAECGCHLSLNWSLPTYILDLYAEFRCRTAGLSRPHGTGLLGALAYFGLEAITAVEKETMRALAQRGGPYTDTEKSELLTYCQTDVHGLCRLFSPMQPYLDWPRALLRGRYMAACARIERNGIPADIDALANIRAHWNEIQAGLISRIDRDRGIYEGRSFRMNRFMDWLSKTGIPWP